ncbi:amino acid adenylation domain [Clostridium sp. CAG:1013]|nr:amino acid adenylation domain [Clostridium sp. CAG:1013]
MKNVLEYLEQSTAAFPEKTAVEDAQGSVTYRQLLDRCLRVGSALAGRLTPGASVAIFMDKGIQALTGFFGSVYGGGFYALINPQLPPARIAQIHQVLQPSWVLTNQEYWNQAQELFPRDSLLLVEELSQEKLRREQLDQIRRQMIDTDPLYAIFTSGSTGVPKGVVVSHRCVLDFMDTFSSLFPLDPQDKVGNQAPFDFDVSVKDIYSCLKTGATLSILPKELFSRPQELVDWLCDRQVTVLIWAVSALCLVSTFHGLDYRQPTTLRRVMFSGEEMPLKHLEHWRSHLPQTEFVNLYGPTEITCNCTYHRLDPHCDYGSGIPIGKAFPNRQVFLLDSHDREVTEPGSLGELCVRGSSLALGYYRAPEQTAARFVQNPLNQVLPDRIYRTGDLASYGQDGELYFRGRKDFQIKYMGHRIELEEIQRAASQLPGVDQCCCVFDQRRNKLLGFYTGAASPQEVRGALRAVLPVYMIPGSFSRLDQLPLTKNGKIDRTRLLEEKNCLSQAGPQDSGRDRA